MNGWPQTSSPTSEPSQGYIRFASKCSFTGDTVAMSTDDQNNLDAILACFQRFLEASGFALNGDVVISSNPNTQVNDDTTD